MQAIRHDFHSNEINIFSVAINFFIKQPINSIVALLFFSSLSRVYADTLPTDNIVANYLLNGNALDATSNAIHGNMVGNSITVPNRFNQSNAATYFDNSHYIYGLANGLPTSDRTISAWIKPSRSTSPSGQGIGIFAYGGGSCGTSWMIVINNADADPGNIPTRIEAQGHCRVNRILCYGAPNLVDNKWHHVAVTTDPSGTNIYLDGAKIASNSIYVTNTNVKDKLFTIGVEVSPDGSQVYTDSSVGNFYGGIDDILVYKRSLSSNEIYKIYNNEPPQLVVNQFTLNKSATTTMTTDMLFATDQQDDLQFVISDIKNGYIQLIDQPGRSINQFTLQQLQNNQVSFVSYSTQGAPAFNVQVTDGLLWSEVVPANMIETLAPTPAKPTGSPTMSSTVIPTTAPTITPTTEQPTFIPTPARTITPTAEHPTFVPTSARTIAPTTEQPTLVPTLARTITPTTDHPTKTPSESPTVDTTIKQELTVAPTQAPTIFSPTAPTQLVRNLNAQVILGLAGIAAGVVIILALMSICVFRYRAFRVNPDDRDTANQRNRDRVSWLFYPAPQSENSVDGNAQELDEENPVKANPVSTVSLN